MTEDPAVTLILDGLVVPVQVPPLLLLWLLLLFPKGVTAACGFLPKRPPPAEGFFFLVGDKVDAALRKEEAIPPPLLPVEDFLLGDRGTAIFLPLGLDFAWGLLLLSLAAAFSNAAMRLFRVVMMTAGCDEAVKGQLVGSPLEIPMEICRYGDGFGGCVCDGDKHDCLRQDIAGHSGCHKVRCFGEKVMALVKMGRGEHH